MTETGIFVLIALGFLSKIFSSLSQITERNSEFGEPKIPRPEFGESEIPKTYIEIPREMPKIKSFPHSLFYGPPGVGKTTLIRLASNRFFEMYNLDEAKYIEMPAGYIDSMARLKEILLNLTPYSIFFIDEIHGLDKKIEEALYTPMQDGIFSDEKGNKIELPPFTLMGATTEPTELNEPLFNRFKLTIPLEPWPVEKLSEIDPDGNPEKDWNAYRWQEHAKRLIEIILEALDNDTEPFVEIPARREAARRTADQTPRTWKSIIQIAKYVARAKNKETVSIEDIIETCETLGINEDGLWKPDLRVLEVLSRIEGHRSAMRRVADLSKIDIGQFKNMVIPRLMRKELISITSRGVGLTEKGIEYCREKLGVSL